MNFQIGDRIAHPLHGAGMIDRVESRRVGGVTREYYVLKLRSTGMVVMIPKNAGRETGVRPIVDRSAIRRLFARIPELNVPMTGSWNRRYRENMQRIKSGDLEQLAGVIKALTERAAACPLSTGERSMLQQARQILLSEISLSADCPYDLAETWLDQCLCKPK